jgi:lactoylglutathione lyase
MVMTTTGGGDGQSISIGSRNRDNPVDAIPDGGHDAARTPKRTKAIGINHVALVVGDIDEALTFYGTFLEFELRGRSDTMAFIDLGDQFIALAKGASASPDGERHFGLVVENRHDVAAALTAMGVRPLPGDFLDFRDPWGNRIQIVEYAAIQFMKNPAVLDAMGITHAAKTADALRELRDKGIDVEQ